MMSREGNNLTETGEFPPPNYGTGLKSPLADEIGSDDERNLPLGDSKKKWFNAICPIRRRYYLVILAFLGFFNVYAMRVNLSVAVLYIANNRTVHYPDGSTVVIPSQFPDLNPVSSAMILGSFFYGYILTQLPGGWLACRYGGKLIFGVGIIVSAAMCLATPLAVGVGYWALIFVRIVQGFFQGVTFPSIQALLSHWAPVQEKTIMATIAVAGCQFGTVVALPLSASLADSFGWPAIFYFFGVLALVWSFFWLLTIGETPHADKSIGKDELRYITSSVGYTFEQVKNVSPPWKSILTSAPVWAIVASHFSENWGFYTMLTELPTYLSKVHNFTLTETGFLSALPYLALGFMGPFAGFLSDYLRVKRGVDTLLVRKMFNCVPLLLQAVFIGVTAHLSTGAAAMTFIVLNVALGGFVWSAFAVNQLDIAPQYAGVLMGLSNTVATIPGIIGPALVGVLAPHNYVSEWQLVFYVIVSVNIFGAAIYAIFASADRQRWSEVSGGNVMTLDD